MDLLATIRFKGNLTWMRFKVNVARRGSLPRAIVVGFFATLTTPGCVTTEQLIDSPGLAELDRSSDEAPNEWLIDQRFSQDDSLAAPDMGDSFAAVIMKANDRRTQVRDTVLESAWPLGATDRPLAAADQLWFAVPTEVDRLASTGVSEDSKPMSAAVDESVPAIVPIVFVDFDTIMRSANVGSPSEQSVMMVDEPYMTASQIAMVSQITPAAFSTPPTTGGDPWQSVMSGTAIGFLGVVLLIPLGCSFIAGSVCGQPRAGPRLRTRRRSGGFLEGLSEAIANVPAH